MFCQTTQVLSLRLQTLGNNYGNESSHLSKCQTAACEISLQQNHHKGKPDLWKLHIKIVFGVAGCDKRHVTSETKDYRYVLSFFIKFCIYQDKWLQHEPEHEHSAPERLQKKIGGTLGKSHRTYRFQEIQKSGSAWNIKGGRENGRKQRKDWKQIKVRLEIKIKMMSHKIAAPPKQQFQASCWNTAIQIHAPPTPICLSMQ